LACRPRPETARCGGHLARVPWLTSFGSIRPRRSDNEQHVPSRRKSTNSRLGYGPRGMDIRTPTNRGMWVPLSSGHMASFDRAASARASNGPTMRDGKHCPGYCFEGLTLYPFPGPGRSSLTPARARRRKARLLQPGFDQHDTLGLRIKDVQFATGKTERVDHTSLF